MVMKQQLEETYLTFDKKIQPVTIIDTALNTDLDTIKKWVLTELKFYDFGLESIKVEIPIKITYTGDYRDRIRLHVQNQDDDIIMHRFELHYFIEDW